MLWQYETCEGFTDAVGNSTVLQRLHCWHCLPSLQGLPSLEGMADSAMSDTISHIESEVSDHMTCSPWEDSSTVYYSKQALRLSRQCHKLPLSCQDTEYPSQPHTVELLVHGLR